MRSWDEKNRVPPAAEWAQAREALLAAHALDPAQPAYLEDLGRLYDLRARPLVADDPLAREYRRQSLEYQRASLLRRPGSPYTWSNIALLKSRLAEPDAEFDRPARNAALLGPWEPGVQIALADAGFAQWKALGPETRNVLLANAGRALRSQDKTIIETARRHGRLDVLCGLPEMRRAPGAGACI